MGAEYYCIEVDGKSAQSAFRKAHQEAIAAYGNSGYTGTLAEKGDYVMVKTKHPVKNRKDFIDGEIKYGPDWLSNNEWADKWGPSGCVKTTNGTYIFFGWASS